MRLGIIIVLQNHCFNITTYNHGIDIFKLISALNRLGHGLMIALYK